MVTVQVMLIVVARELLYCTVKCVSLSQQKERMPVGLLEESGSHKTLIGQSECLSVEMR